MIRIFAVATLLLVNPQSTPPDALGLTPIKIFVGSTQGAAAMTSGDLVESVKDVTARVRDLENIVVVGTREAADLTVTVISRGKRRESSRQRLGYQETDTGSVLKSQPVVTDTWWLSARVEVAATGARQDLVGTYHLAQVFEDRGVGAWKECARALAKDLDVWLERRQKTAR